MIRCHLQWISSSDNILNLKLKKTALSIGTRNPNGEITAFPQVSVKKVPGTGHFTFFSWSCDFCEKTI